MKNIYKPPETEVGPATLSVSLPKKIGVTIMSLLFCHFGVTYLASLINDLFVHLVVERSSDAYKDVRLISDLFQSDIYLFIGGYILGKVYSRMWWLACSIFSLIFLLNFIEIVGLDHLLYETCPRHWYDILAIITIPVMLISGGYIGNRSLRELQGLTNCD